MITPFQISDVSTPQKQHGLHTRYFDDGRDDPVSRLSDKSIGVTEGREHQLNEVRGQMWLKVNATVL